jgi:hypothetical protein
MGVLACYTLAYPSLSPDINGNIWPVFREVPEMNSAYPVTTATYRNGVAFGLITKEHAVISTLKQPRNCVCYDLFFNLISAVNSVFF